jgi:hypothetical protein
MSDDLETRLRARINELMDAVRKSERASQYDAAYAWDLECRLDVVERENVALLAEVRKLRECMVGRGLEA